MKLEEICTNLQPVIRDYLNKNKIWIDKYPNFFLIVDGEIFVYSEKTLNPQAKIILFQDIETNYSSRGSILRREEQILMDNLENIKKVLNKKNKKYKKETLVEKAVRDLLIKIGYFHQNLEEEISFDLEGKSIFEKTFPDINLMAYSLLGLEQYQLLFPINHLDEKEEEIKAIVRNKVYKIDSEKRDFSIIKQRYKTALVAQLEDLLLSTNTGREIIQEIISAEYPLPSEYTWNLGSQVQKTVYFRFSKDRKWCKIKVKINGRFMCWRMPDEIAQRFKPYYSPPSPILYEFEIIEHRKRLYFAYNRKRTTSPVIIFKKPSPFAHPNIWFWVKDKLKIKEAKIYNTMCLGELRKQQLLSAARKFSTLSNAGVSSENPVAEIVIFMENWLTIGPRGNETPTLEFLGELGSAYKLSGYWHDKPPVIPSPAPEGLK